MDCQYSTKNNYQVPVWWHFVLIDLVNSKHVSACIIIINLLISAGKKKRGLKLWKIIHWCRYVAWYILYRKKLTWTKFTFLAAVARIRKIFITQRKVIKFIIRLKEIIRSKWFYIIKYFWKGKQISEYRRKNKFVCHCIKVEFFPLWTLFIFQKERKINKMKSYFILFFWNEFY